MALRISSNRISHTGLMLSLVKSEPPKFVSLIRLVGSAGNHKRCVFQLIAQPGPSGITVVFAGLLDIVRPDTHAGVGQPDKRQERVIDRMLYIGRQRGLVDLGLLMIYEETVDGTEQEHGSYSRHEVVFLVKGTDFPRRVCSVEQQTDEIKIVDRIPGKVSFQRCPVNLFVVQGKRLGKEP